MNIIDQLESFQEFIKSTNPTVVSNIEMRRKYYADHPAEAKKSDLCNKSVDIFKNIVIAFIQLNNANANQTIASINTQLQNAELDKAMWRELIIKITNSINSSNLTISNTKQNHAKLVIVIEKYNAGFIQEFIKYQIQQTFTIEMLDCLMYIYMEFKDIENDLLKYMQNDGKHTFTELLKFINISVIDFSELYEKYISTNPVMTGYMRYVNDEIKNELLK